MVSENKSPDPVSTEFSEMKIRGYILCPKDSKVSAGVVAQW